MQKSINFTKIYVKFNKLYINPDLYQISLSIKRVVKNSYAAKKTLVTGLGKTVHKKWIYVHINPFFMYCFPQTCHILQFCPAFLPS